MTWETFCQWEDLVSVRITKLHQGGHPAGQDVQGGGEGQAVQHGHGQDEGGRLAEGHCQTAEEPVMCGTG